MRIILYSILLVSIFTRTVVGQTEHYIVRKASFSSDIYDEYAPVRFGKGIVFCSNRSNDLFFTYKNTRHKNLFSIYYSDIENEQSWQDTKLLDPSLTTPFNDGPACFNKEGDLIFYSRNQKSEIGKRNSVDPGNMLGLFYSSYTNGEWMNIRPFPHNDEKYSLMMPTLDSTGHILIFSSDMPGGHGGADLYLSRYIDGQWTAPENLGPVINSSANETYPFLSKGGILYFASDRPGGYGKKDIYCSDSTQSGWMKLIHIEAPINSEFDDFGIICDEKFERGWFSSNRHLTDDIFEFETRFRPFYGCDSIKKNYYCFLFSEDNYIENDSISIQYDWTFSDSTKYSGIEVEHCFPGPGKYSVHLKIIQTFNEVDYVTETFHEFELVDHEQVIINSADSCIVNDTLWFDGHDYNLPGFTADEYYWDFGDGTLEIGSLISHVYKKPGFYKVQLGLTGKDQAGVYQENCVFKVIKVSLQSGPLQSKDPEVVLLP